MGIFGEVLSGIGNYFTGNYAGLAKNVYNVVNDDDGNDATVNNPSQNGSDIFSSIGDAASKNSGALASAYSARLAYKGQGEVNESAKQMFGQNLGWQGQSQQNAFSHDREMASAQMAFQDYQSKNQYQRASTDMKAAGLNPILAASRGGNDAMSGSAPTSSGGGGSSIPQLGNKAAAGFAGAASAASISNMHQQNQLLAAQTRNVDAQTVSESNRPENIAQDTRLKTSTARQADYTYVKLKEEAEKIRDYVESKGPKSESDLNRARTKLAEIETQLRSLETNEARNKSNMHNSDFGKKLPYIHEGEKFVNSAAGAIRDIGSTANRARLNKYIIKGQ